MAPFSIYLFHGYFLLVTNVDYQVSDMAPFSIYLFHGYFLWDSSVSGTIGPKFIQRNKRPYTVDTLVDTRIKEPIFVRTLRLKFNISNP